MPRARPYDIPYEYGLWIFHDDRHWRPRKRRATIPSVSGRRNEMIVQKSGDASATPVQSTPGFVLPAAKSRYCSPACVLAEAPPGEYEYSTVLYRAGCCRCPVLHAGGPLVCKRDANKVGHKLRVRKQKNMCASVQFLSVSTPTQEIDRPHIRITCGSRLGCTVRG